MIDPLLIAKFVSRRVRQIESHGLRLRTHADFHSLSYLDIPKKVSRIFDPDIFDLHPGNSLWIEALDAEGGTVHVQAMKMNDLTSGVLSDILMHQLARAFDGDKPESGFQCCPMANRMSGKVVYHGDLWVSHACRGMGLGHVFGQLALGLAMIKWQPDYIYAFTESPITERGFPMREGYVHYQPLADEWKVCHPWLYQEDWFIWLEQTDLFRMVEVDHLKTLHARRNDLNVERAIPGQVPTERVVPALEKAAVANR